MALIGCERWGWWRIGAVLLLIHLLPMAPPARAGCRHPGASLPDRWSLALRLDTLIADDASSAATTAPATDFREGETRPPAPCSGPGCSSQDPAPASTATSDTDFHNRWGDLDDLAFVPRTSSWTQSFEGPAIHPIGGKPSIFHPPPSA
jgi:hypothetical protein